MSTGQGIHYHAWRSRSAWGMAPNVCADDTSRRTRRDALLLAHGSLRGQRMLILREPQDERIATPAKSRHSLLSHLTSHPYRHSFESATRKVVNGDINLAGRTT